MGKHASDGSHVGAFPYHVGVISPCRFDSPGLDAAVVRSLWGLLARKRRQMPISLTTFWGEPIGRAAGVAARRYGWANGSMGGSDDRAEHLRSCVQVCASVDAVVLFHGPELPPEMAWVLAVARRLGTATRSIRVTEPTAGRATGLRQDR